MKLISSTITLVAISLLLNPTIQSVQQDDTSQNSITHFLNNNQGKIVAISGAISVGALCSSHTFLKAAENALSLNKLAAVNGLDNLSLALWISGLAGISYSLYHGLSATTNLVKKSPQQGTYFVSTGAGLLGIATAGAAYGAARGISRFGQATIDAIAKPEFWEANSSILTSKAAHNGKGLLCAMACFFTASIATFELVSYIKNLNATQKQT